MKAKVNIDNEWLVKGMTTILKSLADGERIKTINHYSDEVVVIFSPSNRYFRIDGDKVLEKKCFSCSNKNAKVIITRK